MALILIPDELRDRINILVEQEKKTISMRVTQGYIINKALNLLEGEK